MAQEKQNIARLYNNTNIITVVREAISKIIACLKTLCLRIQWWKRFQEFRLLPFNLEVMQELSADYATSDTVENELGLGL